jgi:hemerythrin
MKNSFDYPELVEPLLLGIPVIDNQHANLARITKNLYFACLNNSEADHRIMYAVRETIDYMRQHFITEERLMVISNFPDYLAHKKEHRDFIWKLLSFSKQFNDGQNFIPSQFVRFLNDWMKVHIDDSDKAFADFFLNMKQLGKIRIILAGRVPVSAQTA